MDNPSLHALLLLSDSALPLGSFAFSSGLESYLAHHKPPSPPPDFPSFLHLSLRNLSSTSLPYVLAAYNKPSKLQDLDNDIDASTPCTVARRASTAQGRALLSLWQRVFSRCANPSEPSSYLNSFAERYKISRPDGFGLQLNAHFAPLFGVVCRALELSRRDVAYVFLLNHAKAVLSAAVRANVIGPYQSQAVLASGELKGWLRDCVGVDGEVEVRDAGLTVPVMDLWMGRHELLYSRIFNS